MAPGARRTGLLVPVHAADDLVGDFRRRHNAASVARRLPPHITVLFPFARAEAVDDSLLADVASLCSAFPRFEAELRAVGRFDGFVWLGPSPRDRFVELIEAACARFPQFPPYGDASLEAEPHLTVAAVDDAAVAAHVAELAEQELGARLPFRFTVDAVALFEERADGTWEESRRFPLG